VQKLIVKMGILKSTILITLSAIVVSFGVTVLITSMTSSTMSWIGVMISILVPLIIASGVNIVLINMIIKIDKLEKETQKLANQDYLTNTLSRRAFIEQAEVLFNLTMRTNQPFSIIYLDLDYFKSINDKFGHSIGDKVLQDFGVILLNNVRKSDIVGRVGGEEFAIILPDTKMKSAIIVADKILEKTQKSVVLIDGNSITYTTSIGISTYIPDLHKNIDELINLADKALYTAKKRGRNRIQSYKLDNVNSK